MLIVCLFEEKNSAKVYKRREYDFSSFADESVIFEFLIYFLRLYYYFLFSIYVVS